MERRSFIKTALAARPRLAQARKAPPRSKTQAMTGPISIKVSGAITPSRNDVTLCLPAAPLASL